MLGVDTCDIEHLNRHTDKRQRILEMVKIWLQRTKNPNKTQLTEQLKGYFKQITDVNPTHEADQPKCLNSGWAATTKTTTANNEPTAHQTSAGSTARMDSNVLPADAAAHVVDAVPKDGVSTAAEAAADVANAARRAADSIQKVAAKHVSAEAADNVAVAAEAAAFRVLIASTKADGEDSTAATIAVAAAARKAAATSQASTGDTAITDAVGKVAAV
ncbi:hypothetical protein LSAT2_003555, partial [Lamellibrachia satsuma]